MPTFTVYRLVPPHSTATLAFHFGRQGIGLEETSETLASDSLFAALVVQAALSMAEVGDDGAPAWVRPFMHGEPPLRHSSLLPVIGELPLLPRPLLPLRLAETATVQAKQLKKLRYLSPELFAAACRGEALPATIIALQQGKVWLTEAEARRLPTPWRPAANESDEAWRKRLKVTPLWQIEATPHVTLDRLSAASAYYEVGRVVFASAVGLHVLVAFHDPAAQPVFEQLLTLLGESGLGGKRSSGYGAFAWQRSVPLTLELPGPHRHAVLLSRYLPTPDELALVRNPRSTYQLVSSSGWFLATNGVTYRRQTVMMVSEGSVLAISDGQLPRGHIIDVRPDNTVTHPIYRSGMALAVPVPEAAFES
ncbi:type III-A CRISPR-associated RAMP protein Csm4 [Chloroflexus sp.]|uniref:type III-A CRISPR-associated RAMP protein Csm4 n=1 Tax=Chloroflexus sp. TaxID=1904827 RepID=UPI002ACDC8E6|nr:type III-A CRISPR-associated RAMP protein Csm4 [Chloroflexus sp.]